jgi:hypothetical protein
VCSASCNITHQTYQSLLSLSLCVCVLVCVALPVARMEHAAAALDERFLLIHGGGGEGGISNTVHLLDTRMLYQMRGRLHRVADSVDISLHHVYQDTLTWHAPESNRVYSLPKRGHALHALGKNWLMIGGKTPVVFLDRNTGNVSVFETTTSGHRLAGMLRCLWLEQQCRVLASNSRAACCVLRAACCVLRAACCVLRAALCLVAFDVLMNTVKVPSQPVIVRERPKRLSYKRSFEILPKETEPRAQSPSLSPSLSRSHCSSPTNSPSPSIISTIAEMVATPTPAVQAAQVQSPSTLATTAPTATTPIEDRPQPSSAWAKASLSSRFLAKTDAASSIRTSFRRLSGAYDPAAVSKALAEQAEQAEQVEQAQIANDPSSSPVAATSATPLTQVDSVVQTTNELESCSGDLEHDEAHTSSVLDVQEEAVATPSDDGSAPSDNIASSDDGTVPSDNIASSVSDEAVGDSDSAVVAEGGDMHARDKKANRATVKRDIKPFRMSTLTVSKPKACWPTTATKKRTYGEVCTKN